MNKGKIYLLLFIIGLCQNQEVFAQLNPTPSKAQNSKEYQYRSQQSGLDFSIFHLNYHQAFAISDKLLLGFEGGFGFNVLSLFLVAGDHFATDLTLFAYEGFDEYDNELYAEGATLQLFARIRTAEKKDLFDIGFQLSPFIHSDDSSNNIGGGTFKGIYIKSFLVPKNKITGTKRLGLGVQFSAGQYCESESTNQFGVRGSFWIRYYFKRGVGKRNY